MAGYDDNFEYEDVDTPEEASNRTFLLIAGILGGLVLLSLLCLGGYLFFSNNNTQTAAETAQGLATQQAATIQVGLTQTSAAQALTMTAAVTNTLPPTNTPVIALPSDTPTPTLDPATATVGAAFTQIAASTQTIVATSTALPNTGFMDDIGAPVWLMTALGLIIVIFLVRQLRSVNNRA